MSNNLRTISWASLEIVGAVVSSAHFTWPFSKKSPLISSFNVASFCLSKASLEIVVVVLHELSVAVVVASAVVVVSTVVAVALDSSVVVVVVSSVVVAIALHTSVFSHLIIHK